MTLRAPLWTSAELTNICGASNDRLWYADGLQIDSRDIVPGDLFVALPGARMDGHDFVDQALANGASAALVRADWAEDRSDKSRLCIVEDTARALTVMARHAVRRAPVRLVGVTGSAGKTSVVQALRQALSLLGPTHASVRSFNNHVGVPLSMARMPRDSRFGVFEMGMSGPDEISALSRLVRPDVAVVTTVSLAHAAAFDGDITGIARAKAEIFDGLVPGGVAVIGMDHGEGDILTGAAAASGAHVMTVSASGAADVCVAARDADQDGTLVTAGLGDEKITYRIGVPGGEWVLNSLLVLGVMRALDIDHGHAVLALETLRLEDGRGMARHLMVDGRRVLLIDDSYNANPASVRAALARLGLVRPQSSGRRIAILSDMAELGPASAKAHASLVPAMAAAQVDRVIAVGAGMARAAAAAGIAVTVMDNAASVAEALPDMLGDGDVLLVKGANSAGLDTVVGALTGSVDPVPQPARMTAAAGALAAAW